MAEQINLDDIKNIPDNEFRQQLSTWIEECEVAKCLQSKLRKDLFDNFNKTSLGRQIAAQCLQTHRIVLSPLILVLNTLVAEFLYSQNCHFSLSVFSTEVPYHNTLPDFEQTNAFRFNADELHDIFEAIGIKTSVPIYNEIQSMYMAAKSPEHIKQMPVNTSLLYCTFKAMFSNQESIQIIEPEPKSKKPNVPTNNLTKPINENNDDDKCKECQINKKKLQTKEDLSNYRCFKQFDHYLDLLSKHVHGMTNTIERVQERTNHFQMDSEKIEKLNKSFEKMAEQLKHYSKAKKSTSKISKIISSIYRLTTEMERCSGILEKLVIYSQQNAFTMPYSNNSQPKVETKTKIDAPLVYSEWVRHLKNSKFGHRFIGHIESYQQKVINREMEKMKKQFEEKLENNRLLIKLYYKQKLLEKCKGAVSSSDGNECQMKNFNSLIDSKLKELKEKEIELTNIAKNNNNKKPINADCLKQNIEPISFNREPKKLTIQRIATINIASDKADIDPAPPIDNIVQVAKNRLEQLEQESNQLDDSLQTYLQKQKTQKLQINSEATTILKNYEMGKTLLQQFGPKSYQHPTVKIQNKTSAASLVYQQQADSLIIYDLDNMNQTICSEMMSLNKLPFNNPFRSYKNDVRLRQTKNECKKVTVSTTSSHLDRNESNPSMAKTKINNNQPKHMLETYISNEKQHTTDSEHNTEKCDFSVIAHVQVQPDGNQKKTIKDEKKYDTLENYDIKEATNQANKTIDQKFVSENLVELPLNYTTSPIHTVDFKQPIDDKHPIIGSSAISEDDDEQIQISIGNRSSSSSDFLN